MTSQTSNKSLKKNRTLLSRKLNLSRQDLKRAWVHSSYSTTKRKKSLRAGSERKEIRRRKRSMNTKKSLNLRCVTNSLRKTKRWRCSETISPNSNKGIVYRRLRCSMSSIWNNRLLRHLKSQLKTTNQGLRWWRPLETKHLRNNWNSSNHSDKNTTIKLTSSKTIIWTKIGS